MIVFKMITAVMNRKRKKVFTEDNDASFKH